MLKQTLIITLTICAMVSLATAQPIAQWTRTFGGTGSDFGYSVQQTSDGGYILTGQTASFGAGGADFWLVKTNAFGTQEWNKTVGGTGSDLGLSVRETSDGGYIIGGYTGSFGAGGTDFWLVRVGPEEPVILSVSDVPHDQGGRVNVEWSASSLDNAEHPLPFYSIWRALPELPLNMNSSLSTKDIRIDFEGTAYRFATIEGVEIAWEWIANQPAHNFSAYAYSAATLYDSSSSTTGIHNFLVSTHISDNPGVFYDSDVGIGYSVDNLAPTAPTGLLAVKGEGATIELTWDEPVDEDFDYFALYRSVESGFDPSGTEPYDVTVDPIFTDTVIEIGLSYYYRLSAFDFSENESEFSQEVSAVIVGIDDKRAGIPAEFSLAQNHPNPFNPETVIEYALPIQLEVNLTIHNLRGQEVALLINDNMPAGNHRVTWYASNVSSGIYFYRLKAGDFVQTRKMVLLK